jgi:hypothetical protein
MATSVSAASSAVCLSLLGGLAACSGLEPVRAPAPPPDHCPDLGGTYAYPGYERQAEACVNVTKFGFGRGLPVPASTGWDYIIAASDIRIEQHDCEQLVVHAPFGIEYHDSTYDRVMEFLPREGIRYRVVRPDPGAVPGYFRVDKWATADIDLVPGPRREVRWGEDSLHLRYRFRAAGFGAGWSRNYLTLVLRKLPDGALLYDLRHDETPGEDGEISCVLPPAQRGTGQ